MQWAVLVYALTVGFVSVDRSAIIDSRDYILAETYMTNAVDTRLDAGVELFDHLRLGGAMDTREVLTPDYFAPYQARFYFTAAAYGRGWELGWAHECDHGVRSTLDGAWLGGGSTSIYLKLSGKSTLF
jgi:hypothetical protein